jgi:TPP-dependent pyruvate/acetoin dehydrogenase alpha subunit
VGIALAKRYKSQPGSVFSYFGDGATSRGDWHEAINFAAVQKLPMIYVCNNNQYAYSTPLALQMPVQNVADRGVAYAMPAEIVDGNDIIAVYQAAQRALQHAQAGKGPAMIECKTFRMTGHSAHDPAEYVPKSMFEDWAKKCPIERLEALMMEWGFLSEAARDELNRRVISEVDDAVSWAEQQPMPDPASLTEGVYEQSGGEPQPRTEATPTISDAVTTAKA